METLALTFGSPHWLWGLLALPAFAALYAWGHFRSRALVEKVVAPRLLDVLAGSTSPLRRAAKAVLVLGALGLALVAMAQPRYGFIQREVKQKGRDVIIAVDTSKSMLATDVAPTRLARAKLLTQDIVRLLKGDRVGLIAFAGSAFLQAPLTLDYSAVVNSLDELDTNVIPKGGTNIADAIATAEQAFGKAEGQIRALVILTDGEELDADGIAAAKRAAEAGIRIFTVGIGSAEGSLIPFRSNDGRQDFVRDRSGKTVQSRLDEARLQEIAKATGGFFVPIGPDAAKDIFAKGIEPMDLAETGVFAARQPLERYQWPLSFAAAFLAIWMLLGDRRRRPRGIPAAALAIMLAMPTTSHASGIKDYEAGNYGAARKAFESHLKSSPDSREAQFDAGTAAYKLNDFDQAVNYFTGSLLSEKKQLREDSSYNLGNSLVRRGEAAQDNAAKKADWKNAIEHYAEALKLNPKNKQAAENRDVVKKLLEDLEKQEKQQQQQKDQKQDQKDQQQDKQNQDQQKKDEKDDQQKQGQKDGQKDDQKKDEQQQKDQKQDQNKDQQDQQKKDQQKQDQKDQKNDQQSQGQKDQQQEPQKSGQDQKKGDQKKSTPVPAPTPEEKKEGEVKSQPGEENKQPAGQAAAAGEEQEKNGEMSAAQARALLKSLNSEEEKVNLLQQPYIEETLHDW